jgi:hypothetical protein
MHRFHHEKIKNRFVKGAVFLWLTYFFCAYHVHYGNGFLFLQQKRQKKQQKTQLHRSFTIGSYV